mgnify:CR=1 FL=1
MKQNRENPFFETYRTPFGTPPFDQIETEQYEPAFDEGIWQLDEEVRAIADNRKRNLSSIADIEYAFCCVD